jgi:hypothetical protein
MKLRRLLVPVVAGCAIFGLAAPAGASPPEMFSESGSSSEPGFVQCDGFAIDLETTTTEDVTVYFDETGEVVKFLVRTRATDILTNSVTGKTVVNRGVFQLLGTRVEGTDEFTEALVGFQFLGTSPGEGLVLQDVGRTVFSPEGEIVFRAGQHKVPEGPEAEALFCAALS